MNVNIEKRAGRRHFVEAGVVRAKLIRIVDQFQFSFNFFYCISISSSEIGVGIFSLVEIANEYSCQTRASMEKKKNTN